MLSNRSFTQIFHDLIYNKVLFVLLFFCFFIIHGEIVFHKISFWDNIISCFGTIFYENDPLPHGKWFSHVIVSFLRLFFGAESLPVINGIVVALSLSLFAIILFSMFNITDTVYKVAFGFILLSIPSVAGSLAYGVWTIGHLLSIIAAYITCEAIHKKGNISLLFLGGFLFACALGCYQCHFALYCSICMVFLINYILLHEVSHKDFFKYFYQYVLSIVVGIGLYLLILQFFLHFEGIKLLSYANTDTYGIVSFQKYIDRIIFSYKLFFNPYLHFEANMFPFHWKIWYKLLYLIILLLSSLFMLLSIKQNKKTTLYQFWFLLLLFPMVLNFNGVLYDWQFVHSLHVYQQVLLFFMPFILYRAIFMVNNNGLTSLLRFKYWIRSIVICTTVVFAILYIRYDNYCYMLSEFRQTQAISYFTTLSTRIMTVKGYKKGLPVSFINETMKQNDVDTIQQYFDFPSTIPFHYPIVNSYIENSRAFMKYWCGFSPRFIDAKLYENNSIVKAMPCYPDDGSIKVIDHVIVVKFK